MHVAGCRRMKTRGGRSDKFRTLVSGTLICRPQKLEGKTGFISMEYLWYTVAPGNGFHTDAEPCSPLWIFSLFRRHGTPATCKRRRGGEKKKKGEAGKKWEAERFFLTVHDDLYDPQINLAASHLATLTSVGALVGLLYSTDLEVVVAKYLEPNWGGGKKTENKRNATWRSEWILAVIFVCF